MLTGQTIGIFESLLISVIGLLVVMLGLGLISLFISLMSKALSGVASGKKSKAALAPDMHRPVEASAAGGEDDEDIMMAVACVCAETGRRPEQIAISYIKKL